MGASVCPANTLIEHMCAGQAARDTFTTVLKLTDSPEALAIKSPKIIVPEKDDRDKKFESWLLHSKMKHLFLLSI